MKTIDEREIPCFLCDLLSHLVPNDYSCKDTFSFVSQIKNANLSKKNSCFLRCN